MNKLLKYELCTTCSILGTTFLLGSGLVLSNFVSADTTDAVDTLTITVNNSCSIARADGNTGSYSSAIANGNTGTITGTTFKTTCNDSGGYSIYAVGYSNDTDSNTDLIAASPLASDYNIATGTATSGSTSNWAMKLAAGADGSTIQNSYSGFKAVPSTYTKVTTKASGTTPASTTTATITYQVYIANEQPAGTYTGKVKYTLVHPSTACPEGYTLEGGVCTAPSLTSITTMQAMTPAICNATSVGTSKQLKDTRDNKYYWVTKLADGNCWMTQNLDYDISSTANTISLTDGGSGTWDSSATYSPQSTTTTIFHSTNNLDTYSYDPGDYYLPNGIDTDSDHGATAVLRSTAAVAVGYSLTSSSAIGNTNLHYHLGNYYQLNAAMAGTAAALSDFATAPGSICPSGWILPGASSYTKNKTFGRLTDAYGITNGENTSDASNAAAAHASPLWFVDGGRLINQPDSIQTNHNGFYISGQVWYSSGFMNGFYISSSTDYPYVSSGGGYTGYHGASVRCVNK